MLFFIPNSPDPKLHFDAAYNIAFEEYVFETFAEKEDCFILWRNDNCIVVGKHQNTLEELDKAYCDAHGIKIVRRLSGGGAVYHDLQNLNYTIISSDRAEAFDFKSFAKPVIETLAKLGLEASFSGRNDILLGDQKFCGNAQYKKGKRIMHHGCMMFDVDLSVLAGSLKVSPDKIASKGRKSVRSRVINIRQALLDKYEGGEGELPGGRGKAKDYTIEDYQNDLIATMDAEAPMTRYAWTAEDEAKVLEIMARRNGSWDWVFGQNPEFSLRRKRRFDAGTIEAALQVKDGRIQDLRLFGDFFGAYDLGPFYEALRGAAYDRATIRKILEGMELPNYFFGFTLENILDVLIA